MAIIPGYTGGSSFNVKNGIKKNVVCYGSVESKKFVNKMVLGGGTTNIGTLPSDWTRVKIKHVVDDKYVACYERGTTTRFEIAMIRIPVDGPVTVGTSLYISGLVDGLGGLDIEVHDENHIISVFEGWGRGYIEYHQLNWDDMTITTISEHYLSSTYAYVPTIVKIDTNRFVATLCENYDVQLLVIEVANGAITYSLIPTGLYDSEDFYNLYLIPLKGRTNEFLIQCETNPNSKYPNVYYKHAKYVSGSITYGTSVHCGLDRSSNKCSEYDLSYAYPDQFDICVGSGDGLFAINISGNVITMLKSLTVAQSSDMTNAMVFSESDSTVILARPDSSRYYKTSEVSPYLTYTKSVTNGNNKSSGWITQNLIGDKFKTLLHLGANNSVHQTFMYDGTEDVVREATEENVYGVSLTSGENGKVIECVVYNLGG